jgi:hypothetical protein
VIGSVAVTALEHQPQTWSCDALIVGPVAIA